MKKTPTHFVPKVLIILLPTSNGQEKPHIPLKHRHSHSFINRRLRVEGTYVPLGMLEISWKTAGQAGFLWKLVSLIAMKFRALGWLGELCQFQVGDVVDVSHLYYTLRGLKISKLSTYQKLTPCFGLRK